MRARSILLIAVSTTSALLAGCGNRAETPAEPSLASIPVLTSASQIQIPLYSYNPSSEDLKTIGQAHGVLAGKCLSTYGFSTSIGFFGMLPPPSDKAAASAIGWLEQQSATAYGYHPPISAAEKEVQRLNLEGRRALGSGGSLQGSVSENVPQQNSPIRSVFYGRVKNYGGKPVPAGGCATQSENILTAGSSISLVAPGKGLPGDLWRQAYPRMEQDSRVVAVSKRWTSCMAAAGFHYKSPADAEGDQRWGEGSASTSVSSAEIATATSDAHCRLNVNYAGVRMAVLAAYQQKLIDKNVTGLNAFKNAISIQARNATKALAGN